MTIQQLSIFVENKPGKLVEALEILGDNNIDLRALSLADTSDFGILRVIVDKPGETLNILQKAEYLVKTTDVIAIAVGDKPGGLASALRVLANQGIDVEYTYAFVAHSHDNAFVILRVEDNAAAIKTLQEKGITVMNASQIYGM